MKTLTISDRPLLIGALLTRAQARQERRKARAAALQSVGCFLVAAIIRPVVGFAVGVVLALYLASLWAHYWL